MSRLTDAVGKFLSFFPEDFEPTASVTRHLPVPELNELKAAYAEELSPPSAPEPEAPLTPLPDEPPDA